MIWSPLLMKYHDGIVFHAAYFDGCLEGTCRRRPLSGPQTGGDVCGEIVAEVVQEDVLLQIQVHGTGRSAGIRKFLEQFAFRLLLEY